MNHRLDDPVGVSINQVKGALDVAETDPMGDHEIDVDAVAHHHLDGALDALVLTTDVLDAQLAPPHGVRLESDPVVLGDADEHQLAARLEQRHPLVDGGLFAAALEDHVKQPGFGVEDRRDALGERVDGEVGTVGRGKLASIGQRLG